MDEKGLLTKCPGCKIVFDARKNPLAPRDWEDGAAAEIRRAFARPAGTNDREVAEIIRRHAPKNLPDWKDLRGIFAEAPTPEPGGFEAWWAAFRTAAKALAVREPDGWKEDFRDCWTASATETERRAKDRVRKTEESVRNEIRAALLRLKPTNRAGDIDLDEACAATRGHLALGVGWSKLGVL